MSLRRRLCFGLGASLAALGATLFFWLGSAIEDGARREAVVQLERAAAVARVALAGRIPSDALADSLGRASGLRFTLLSRDGRVLGDSELEARLLAELPALEDRPEIRGAVAGAPTAAERVSPTAKGSSGSPSPSRRSASRPSERAGSCSPPRSPGSCC